MHERSLLAPSDSHSPVAFSLNDSIGMGEPSVVDQLKRSMRVSEGAGKEQLHQMELLMESGKDLCLEQAKQLVKDSGSMPILVSYSCDGTPCKEVLQTVEFKQPQSKSKRGSGSAAGQRRAVRQGFEVMVEHTFPRYFDDLGS